MQACCGNDLGWAAYLPLRLLDFREDDTEGLDHFQKFDLQRGETQKNQELGDRKHLPTIPGCETFEAWKQLEEECRPSRACPLCAGPQDGAGHGLGRTPRDSLAMTTASRLRDRRPGPNLLRPGWSEGARPRHRDTSVQNPASCHALRRRDYNSRRASGQPAFLRLRVTGLARTREI